MTLYLDSLPTCVTGPDQVPAIADPKAGGRSAGDGFASGSAAEGVCCAVAGGVCCAAGGCVPWVGGGSRGHLFSKLPCAPAATTGGPAVIAIKAATQFRIVPFITLSGRGGVGGSAAVIRPARRQKGARWGPQVEDGRKHHDAVASPTLINS